VVQGRLGARSWVTGVRCRAPNLGLRPSDRSISRRVILGAESKSTIHFTVEAKVMEIWWVLCSQRYLHSWIE
jgi:hypothetical protein